MQQQIAVEVVEPGVLMRPEPVQNGMPNPEGITSFGSDAIPGSQVCELSPAMDHLRVAAHQPGPWLIKLSGHLNPGDRCTPWESGVHR